MNAPLSGAEIFTIVLIDHEAWACDLEVRDINGRAWCIQFYLLWMDGFFARSEPWANRGDEGVPWRSIASHDIALCGKSAKGRVPNLPASRQPNCRKLLPTLGFEHRRADIGERAKELDTADLESLPCDLQGFQLARFARAIPGLDQISRSPIIRQYDANR